MNYEIVPDSKLSIELIFDLGKSKKTVLSDTEAGIMKKSPWLWYLISGDIPEKNKEFYRDAGYCSFETVITMDNSLHNAMSENYLENISIKDVNIAHKIKHLNKLADLLGAERIKTNGSNFLNLFYQCKMKGFELADVCAKQLDDEYVQGELNVSDMNKKIFAEVLQNVYSKWAEIAFVKGSYVDYVESGGRSKTPHDIDLGLLSCTNQEEYYEMMKVYNEDARVGKIKVVPLVIPYELKDSHSFFDLDISPETKFIYSFKDENIILRKNPEKIIRTAGNRSLKRLRETLSDEERINDFLSGRFAHSKIYSTIRKPELIYKKLKQNNLAHIADVPEKFSEMFELGMSVGEIQLLMAYASMENSRLNKELYNYMNSRRR